MYDDVSKTQVLCTARITYSIVDHSRSSTMVKVICIGYLTVEGH